MTEDYRRREFYTDNYDSSELHVLEFDDRIEEEEDFYAAANAYYMQILENEGLLVYEDFYWAEVKRLLKKILNLFKRKTLW